MEGISANFREGQIVPFATYFNFEIVYNSNDIKIESRGTNYTYSQISSAGG